MLSIDTAPVPAAGFHPGPAIAAGLDTPSRQQLFCLSETRRVPAKATVFFEGDPCEFLYEVVEGVVGLYKLTPDGRRQVTGFAYPGQLLGLEFGSDHAYTAEAVSDAKLCRYRRSKLETILEEMPGLGRRLLAMAASDLAAAQDQMLLLGRKTAIEKLATFLLRLSEMNETRGEKADRVFLPMNRGDIADYLGLTTETVSRVIGRLKSMGLIDLGQPSRIRLRDIDGLTDIAEGDEPALA